MKLLPFTDASSLTTKCYYGRGVQVLQIQIIKVKWMFRIVNYLSLMTVKVMMISQKKMALLFLNLESTFNVSIRHTDEDVEELIVALVLHQVQSSRTFYSHV